MNGNPPPHFLFRYVVAAAFARTADGGAVVAIVLLVTANGGNAGVAGFLAACITAPHILGPFLARRIDLVDDGRKTIASACLVYAAAFAAAVASYGKVPLALTGGLLVSAGLCGPLLTGGISSRLPAIAGHDRASQRRAQGWDVASYGIGGTAGSSVVAAVSGWLTPAWAAQCLAVAALFAALLIMRLPRTGPDHGGNPDQVPHAWSTVRYMATDGRLRRTLYMTAIVACAVAALPIAAVHMTDTLDIPVSAAAAMTAAYGIGNLAGSVGLMARPLGGSPDKLMSSFALYVGAALLAAMISPALPSAVAAFFCAGALNAVFFAATLAARSEYSPAQFRGQVFLWVAAVKITAGAAGTAAAGMLAYVNGRLPLLVAAGLVVFAVIMSTIDRGMASVRVR